MEESPPYKGHRQRLRERFLATGAPGLREDELLELVLYGANPRGDTKPLARALLKRFGCFSGVIAARQEALQSVAGVGEVVVATLKVIEAAAVHLARERVIDRPVISNWDALIDYCRAAMAHQPVEQFRILFLDRQNALLGDEVQQRGTVDHTPVYPREIVRRALDLHASSLILVHNHPSGNPAPSKEDISLTREIVRAAAALGLTIHDHIIIGRAGHFSFSSKGLL